MRIALVLPAHNEGPNIQRMVAGVLERYGGAIHDVIIVDDASTDDTAAQVRMAARRCPQVRLVRRRPPCGVGRALKAGFRAVGPETDYVLMMDSDFLDSVDEVQRLIDKIQEGYDGVVGSRFLPGSRLVNYPWPKLAANRAFHWLAGALLGVRQHDLSNNFKLYRVEIVKEIRWRSHTFAINAETGLWPLLYDYRIAEVPVSWVDRAPGMGLSKFRLWRFGPDYARVFWWACVFKAAHLWTGALTPQPNERAARRHYDRLAQRPAVQGNAFCRQAYDGVAREAFSATTPVNRLLQLSSGNESVIDGVRATQRVWANFSESMLRRRDAGTAAVGVVADGDRLPFASESFDGILCVNLIEHVSRPRQVIRECHRVLADGGRLVLVTPNGDAAWALEWAEMLRLKLPEGPHRFFTRARLRALAAEWFQIDRYDAMLALPIRPWMVARAAERMRGRLCPSAGLVQCLIATKRG